MLPKSRNPFTALQDCCKDSTPFHVTGLNKMHSSLWALTTPYVSLLERVTSEPKLMSVPSFEVCRTLGSGCISSFRLSLAADVLPSSVSQDCSLDRAEVRVLGYEMGSMCGNMASCKLQELPQSPFPDGKSGQGAATIQLTNDYNLRPPGRDANRWLKRGFRSDEGKRKGGALWNLL